MTELSLGADTFSSLFALEGGGRIWEELNKLMESHL